MPPFFFFWAKADNVLIVFSEFNTCKTQRDYYVWVIVHVSGNHTNLTWIRQEFNTKTWQFKFYMFYHPCNIEMISEGSFLAVEDCWEGWWSILACSLAVVETNSWCAPLPHFGQMKVWDKDGRDAVRSFCLLRFSFAALCLSALNSQLALLTDEYQLSRSEASCCHDWWLIPAVQAVSSAEDCIPVATNGGGWYNTSVFFRPMVMLKFLAASDKQLVMCCRASSVWVRRAQWSANSSSVMSSSMVFVPVRRCRRLKRLLSVRKQM